ncbi:cytochrome P450 [Streptomyces sp. NPDC090127]|uniref:cytochrome P450 n=1 Tax=Streptomyces sp. NPDC090127 TaxID=3365953 RepID=UPI0038197DAF
MTTEARKVPRAPGGRGPLSHLGFSGLYRGAEPVLARLRSAGPLVRIRKALYLVNDPDLMRTVLTDTTGRFAHWSAAAELNDVFGHGLVALGPDAYRQRRARMLPAFTSSPAKDAGPMIYRIVSDFAASLPEDRPVDVAAAMTRLTAKLITHCLLRAPVADDVLDLAARWEPAVSQVIICRLLMPSWALNLPTPQRRRFRRALAARAEVALRTLEAHRPPDDGEDVLSLLGNTSCPTARRGAVSREALLAEISTLVFGGLEGTVATLAWACHELASHPDIEEAVLHEADALAAAGGLRPGHVWADVLPATGRFIQEVERVHPPTALMRDVRRPTVLGGFHLPEGARLCMPLREVHHDPGLITDPGLFDPDRWLPENVEASACRAVTPFGLPPRRCIAAPLATVLVPVAIAAMAAQRRFRPAHPGRAPRTGLRVIAHPVRLMMFPQPLPTTRAVLAGAGDHPTQQVNGTLR